MQVVNQVIQFLKRHRRAIGIGVGVTAAGIALWRLKRVLDEYKQLIKEHDLSRIDQHRLQMHMLRSRGECIPALLNFMQTLRRRVNESVDVTSAVKTLKSRRGSLTKEEEQQLWEQVKISGFVRFFLAYYAFNLLNVMLRVQVHILGRYAFENSKHEVEAFQRRSLMIGVLGAAAEGEELGKKSLEEEGVAERHESFSNEDRCKLLSLIYEYFLGQGLRQLKEAIEAAVVEELGEWSVHEKVRVSYSEFHDRLLSIRRRLEGPRGITVGELPLLRYVIDVEAKTEDFEGKLNEMVNETWDAIESSSFKLAVEDCLDVTFRVFLEDVYTQMYVPSAQEREERRAEEESEVVTTLSSEPQESGQGSGPEPKEGRLLKSMSNEKEPPLAKLIAHMKNAASKLFNNDPQFNDYIRVTADNRSVNLLCSSFFTSEMQIF